MLRFGARGAPTVFKWNSLSALAALLNTYLSNEATYRDLYEEVWTYADWAKEQGQDGRDTGIDLVAKTQGTNEYHAIQCKLYAAHIWYKCARPARWTHFRRGGLTAYFNTVLFASR